MVSMGEESALFSGIGSHCLLKGFKIRLKPIKDLCSLFVYVNGRDLPLFLFFNLTDANQNIQFHEFAKRDCCIVSERQLYQLVSS